MQLYQHIREVSPDRFHPLINMGVLHFKAGDLDVARVHFERFLEAVGGMHGDGVLLDRQARQLGESPCCGSVHVSARADCINVLNNLGALELTQDRNVTSAVTYLGRAVEIADKDEALLTDVYSNLGSAHSKIGDVERAADAFIRGFWANLRAGRLNAAVGLLVRRAIIVPVVAESFDQIEKTRTGIDRRVDAVMSLASRGGSSWTNDASDLFRVAGGISVMRDIQELPGLAGTITDWTTAVQLPAFHYHYLGLNDLPIQSKIAGMFEQLCAPSLLEIAPHLALPDEEAFGKSAKKRVAFVSSLIGGDEPHGLLFLDIIKSLRDMFDFYVVSIGSKALSDKFLKYATAAYSVGYDDSRARSLLKSLELDCLIFGEVMNDPIVYFLGYQRYASVQILVQGSPVSSGVPAIDYFVSGDMLENPFRTQLPDDKVAYSEQLVLFDGQAISFPREQFHPEQDSRLAAGEAIHLLSNNMTALEQLEQMRSDDANIYLCFQSIFKLQPSFDYVMADVLTADPKARIVLQASRSERQTLTLQSRLKSVLVQRLCSSSRLQEESGHCVAADSAYARIHFLPRVKSNEIIPLMQKASVILHPFPFGGSKTASDAIGAGVPLVTYPQQFLRGRMSLTFLKSMALEELEGDVGACCIASSVSDYVSKALRLGNDMRYRNQVAAAFKARSHRIYDNKRIAFEWARFLTRALEIPVVNGDLGRMVGLKWEEQDSPPSYGLIEEEQNRWRRNQILDDVYHLK